MDFLPSETNLFLASAVTGVASHMCFFKTAELETHALAIFIAFVSSLLAVVKVVGTKATLLVAAGYFPSLAASIVAYRVWFHPLNKFPGPPGAKVSKFWSVLQIFKSKFRMHHVYQGLQKQYGDFVRTGPRELAIFHPEAVKILKQGYAFRKGPLYDGGETSLHMNRNKDWHRKHRKTWDEGIKKSRPNTIETIEETTVQLRERIAEVEGEPVLLNEICNSFSYDVMSTFAFGHEIGLTKGDASDMAKRVIQSIRDGIFAVTSLLQIPWALDALTRFAFLIKPLRDWNEWSELELQKRQKMQTPCQDIMKHLLENASKNAEGERYLFADARLMIAAGSDTTGNTLTIALCCLGAFPDCAKEVYDEISNEKDSSCGTPSPAVDGFINEVLRLFPPVTINAPREAPPEGLEIDNVFIPGGTIMITPFFSLARDERNFVRPNDFLPKRWSTDKKSLILNEEASMPFSKGPYKCPGSDIAYMEMRSVVKMVAKNYDVSLPPDFDFRKFDNDALDLGVISPKDLFVTFVPRKKA